MDRALLDGVSVGDFNEELVRALYGTEFDKIGVEAGTVFWLAFKSVLVVTLLP